MRTKISGTRHTPQPNSWKENLFISESAIISRYMAEKKLIRLVLNGDYDGARALLDSLPQSQEYYRDFAARIADDVERQRQLALIMNSGLRMTLLNTNVPVTILHGIATYFGRAINEADADTLRSGALMDAILRTYCGMVQEFGRKTYSPPVERIVEYIFANLTGELSLQQIAEQFSYSTVYVNRILKRETGCSAIQFIKQKRIALAKAMLYLDDISVEEVSAAVGFNSFNYFCRVFRQVGNMSPTEYREKAVKERAGARSG